MRPPVLLLPGWTNSGPLHWQSLWQKANPAWNRVEQDDWLNPEPGPWVGSLRRAVAAAEAPPILVGHSLGALTIARLDELVSMRDTRGDEPVSLLDGR